MDRSHHRSRRPPTSASIATVSLTMDSDPAFVSSQFMSSTCRNDDTAKGSVSSSVLSSRVLVDDRELLARAKVSRLQLGFGNLHEYEWKAGRSDFRIGTKPKSRAHHVFAAGEIRCSLEEITQALICHRESEYNAAMTALHRKKFIYGSVVRLVSSEDDQNNELGLLPGQQLVVKTGTFVRSNVFSRNEQWCFLEFIEQQQTSVTLTFTTLLEHELVSGKADKTQVDQLHDMIAGINVQQTPDRQAVAVFFHARFDGKNSDVKGNASAHAMRARMMSMAKYMTRLPELIRRRRLGAQTIAKHAAFAQIKNSRCICCTSSLGLFTKKTRCDLCGYFVCEECSSMQDLETRHNVTTMAVCNRCLDCVDCCDFRQVQPDQLGGPRIIPDVARTKSVHSSSSSSTNNYDVLTKFLEEELAKAAPSRKMSVMKVIQHLVDEDNESNRSATTKLAAPRARDETVLTDTSSEREYLEALAKHSQIARVLPMEDCRLAQEDGRPYPINHRMGHKTSFPENPVPSNETKRLQVIKSHDLLAMDGSEELDLICSLAARELDCPVGFVNIITEDSQVALASNVEAYRKHAWPRDEVLCSHTIMDPRPLVLPHMEADLRFHNLPLVAEQGFSFYCGFPLVASDDQRTIIGAVCCLDYKSRELTQSQYSAMTRLATTASAVVQRLGKTQTAARRTDYQQL